MHKKFPDYVPPTQIAYRPDGATTLHLRKCRIAVETDGEWIDHVFDQAVVTMGSQPDNDLVLSDDTVSRNHCRLYQEGSAYVLRDLDSTNGTKVNGVECQLKILRHGDLISVGRSLMLVGSETQIAARLAAMGNENPTVSRDEQQSEESIALNLGAESNSLHPAELIQVQEVPEIPTDLSPGQKAQLCEILDFLQSRLKRLIEAARTDENSQEVVLKMASWQRMLDTQSKLASMARQIADPDWPNS